MTFSRRLAAASLLLLLVACSSRRQSPVEPVVRGALNAVEIPLLLSHENLAVMTALPSALFGTFAGSYLAQDHTFAYGTALSGLEAQMQILYGGEKQDETMSLVESLGSALQVDAFDLLNRSANREQTLSQYLQALQKLLEDGEHRMEALKAQRKTIGDERSAQRRVAGDLQHDLNKALRAKDYPTAATKQEELTEADRKLGDVDAQSRRVQSLIDILDDLLEIGHERYVAMDLNRAALVAGVRVVEVPGIEDVGLLQSQRR